MSEAKYVIEAKDLGRKYGKYTALDKTNFVVEGPTVLAIVGKKDRKSVV